MRGIGDSYPNTTFASVWLPNFEKGMISKLIIIALNIATALGFAKRLLTPRLNEQDITPKILAQHLW